MKKIYFVSGNENKFNEMKVMFDIQGIELELCKSDIQELQTEDVEKLIKHKANAAYKMIRRPLIVEHTSLCIQAFNNLPGLQTSYFYSRFGYQDIVDFCNYKKEFRATVESIFCYCDGTQYIIGRGKEEGKIVEIVECEKGGFAWDKIFVPNKDNKENKTYAQLGIEKNRRSMRKDAWENLKYQAKDVFQSLSEEQEEDISDLISLIKQKKVMLFVGAGISASIGFSSWRQLVFDLGKSQGYDGELFLSHGDNMMLAEFAHGKDDNLVYEMLKRQFDFEGNKEIEEKIEHSEIYKIIMELDFPVIYTTNYDRIIEKFFEIHKHKYDSVVNIADMGKTDRNNTRIMKFHGDIKDEESIVLSESQYFARMDFRSFMDIQLQADMLQYHVLFLGYSLSDINVKLLLYLMRQQREKSGDKKKAYIFTATPNKVQKEVFEKNDIITFSGDFADKGKGTLEFLRNVLQKYNEV